MGQDNTKYPNEGKVICLNPNSTLSLTNNKSKTIFESVNISRFSFDELIAQINSSKIIIINEHHKIPQNRIFWRQLSTELKNHGFNKIFVETLSNDDSLFLKKGIVTNNTGYYSSDPNFAKFLSHSWKLGYKIMPYEFREHNLGKLNFDSFVVKVSDSLVNIPDYAKEQSIQMSKRDFWQARNIISNLNYNDDKIIIFCGHGHVAEAVKQYWLTLGFWLKYFLNTDVTSIDMTTLTNFENGETDYQLYSLTHDNNFKFIRLNDSIKSRYKDYSIASHIDYLAVSPPIEYEGGRETWINYFKDAELIDFTNKINILDSVYYCYVYLDSAYIQHTDVIPFDALKITPYIPTVKLYVPKGVKYRIIVRNRKSEVLQEIIEEK